MQEPVGWRRWQSHDCEPCAGAQACYRKGDKESTEHVQAMLRRARRRDAAIVWRAALADQLEHDVRSDPPTKASPERRRAPPWAATARPPCGRQHWLPRQPTRTPLAVSVSCGASAPPQPTCPREPAMSPAQLPPVQLPPLPASWRPPAHGPLVKRSQRFQIRVCL